MGLSRKVRNIELSEQADVIRAAVNADAKEYKQFKEAFSNESEDEKEARLMEDGLKKLQKLFGGA